MINDKLTLQNYIDDLQSRGLYWFIKGQVQSVLKLSDNAFKKATHRLALKNKLVRVKGDFYTIIPPEYRATGSLPASWFINAFMKHLNQSYYVGGLSAAALHGAAHQQPMTFQVVTNKSLRSITVGQVKIDFLYKKIIKPSYFQQIKTPTGFMNVSTAEMTAFDLVRYVNAAGQINNVATILNEMADLLNSELLTSLLEKDEIEVTVAQRLGFLLERLAINIDLRSLENQIKQKKPTSRLLVTGSNAAQLEYNQRWKIIVNEAIETDDL